MELKKLNDELTVCKVNSAADIDLSTDLYFIGKTDEELSLVCKTEDVPEKTIPEFLQKIKLAFLLFPHITRTIYL